MSGVRFSAGAASPGLPVTFKSSSFSAAAAALLSAPASHPCTLSGEGADYLIIEIPSVMVGLRSTVCGPYRKDARSYSSTAWLQALLCVKQRGSCAEADYQVLMLTKQADPRPEFQTVAAGELIPRRPTLRRACLGCCRGCGLGRGCCRRVGSLPRCCRLTAGCNRAGGRPALLWGRRSSLTASCWWGIRRHCEAWRRRARLHVAVGRKGGRSRVERETAGIRIQAARPGLRARLRGRHHRRQIAIVLPGIRHDYC